MNMLRPSMSLSQSHSSPDTWQKALIGEFCKSTRIQSSSKISKLSVSPAPPPPPPSYCHSLGETNGLANCLTIDHMHDYFLVLDKPAQSFPVNCTVLSEVHSLLSFCTKSFTIWREFVYLKRTKHPRIPFQEWQTWVLNITWVNLLNCSATHCYDWHW